MKFRSTIITCFLFPFCLAGQIKHDYVWVMGSNGMPNDTTAPNAARFGVNILDFNQGELNITRKYQDSNYFLSHASISSTNGELLFTSNGCSIFQADGEVMENGSGLNPGVAYSTGNCPDFGHPVQQGIVVLPSPGNENIYHVFHNSAVWGESSPFLVYNGIIYKTTIEMTANDGKGNVLTKNEIIYSDSLNSYLQAVKHVNEEDWWIVFGNALHNRHYTVLLTSQGVTGVFEQAIGPNFDPNTNTRTALSPDGTKMAQYDLTNQVRLYEFDRETGYLSNMIQLVADTTLEGYDGSVSFSPSGRFLYVSSILRIYQFDLEASDVQASRVLLDEYDGYMHLGTFPAHFGFMQLAPNCRIYMSTRSTTPFYHVINHPDRKGHECGFVQRGQPLIATTASSIPNNPNYNLGTGFPVCDSTIQLVVSSVPVLPPQQEVRVYPNPASSYITIAMPQPPTANGEWSLYNALGQRVLVHKLEKGMTEMQVTLSGLSSGLYFWEVRSWRKKGGSGKLVITP